MGVIRNRREANECNANLKCNVDDISRYLVSSMVSQYLVWLCWRLLLLLTVALHALVAQPVQDGAALVADGRARLVVVLHPGVRPPSHLLTARASN